LIVIDASAMIELLLRTPRAQALETRLSVSGLSLHAPHLIDIETASALRRLANIGAVTEERGRIALERLGQTPLIRYPHEQLMLRIWRLRQNVTAYDAAYVALAEALDAPLVTCDLRLARAGGHRARIEAV
jgi:predicted nucleic acid-binding protein